MTPPARQGSDPATYCPCAGQCHHSEHPCSLGCWAAQKPWRVEEAALAAATPAPSEDRLRTEDVRSGRFRAALEEEAAVSTTDRTCELHHVHSETEPCSAVIDRWDAAVSATEPGPWNAADHREDAKVVQEAMQRLAERRLPGRELPYVPVEDASDLLMALHHAGLYRAAVSSTGDEGLDGWTRATAKGTAIDVDEWGRPLYVRSEARAEKGQPDGERITDARGDELEHGEPDYPGQFEETPRERAAREKRDAG